MGLDPVDMARDGLGCIPRENVLRRLEGCVDPAAPWGFACVRHAGQLEIERVPICVEDQVMEQPFAAALDGDGDAVRILAPVGLTHLDAVPGQVRQVQELVEAHAGRVNVPQEPLRVELDHETMNILMFREQCPIEPARFIVLTIGVVVS